MLAAAWRRLKQIQGPIVTNLSAGAAGVGRPASDKHPSQPAERVQTNLVARVERSILDDLCRQIPDWTTPDQLTAVGLAGAGIAGLAYWASAWRQEFVFVACVGLVINWLGDSLDGSLARHRSIERPRYGYFLDHSVDSIGVVIILIGIGASPFASMSAALYALVGYLLMIIHVAIRNHVTGSMQLTFAYCGPTEIRILLISISCFAYFLGLRAIGVHGVPHSIYSIILLVVGTTFVLLFLIDTVATSRRLKAEEAELPRPNNRRHSKDP